MIRRAMLAILALGIVGTLAELLLLKHTDGFWQMAPVALLGAGLLVLLLHALAPGPIIIRALQATMAIFLVSGMLGVALHYKGNVEWELERMPSLSGFALFKAAMMGATPALAPGTMLLLGLVGLLYTYCHPAYNRIPENPA